MLPLFYSVVSTDQHFTYLFTFLKRNQNKKVLVVCHTQEEADHLEVVLRTLFQLPTAVVSKNQPNFPEKSHILCSQPSFERFALPVNSNFDWILFFDASLANESIIRSSKALCDKTQSPSVMLLLHQEVAENFLVHLRVSFREANIPVELQAVPVAQSQMMAHAQREFMQLVAKQYNVAAAAEKAFKSLFSAVKKSAGDETAPWVEPLLKKNLALCNMFGLQNPVATHHL